MADIHRPDPASSPPPIGRRLFLAGTAGAAALLATQRVPRGLGQSGSLAQAPSPLGWPPATRPRPGRCCGLGWPSARWSRTAARRAGRSRSSGRWAPDRGWAASCAVARRWPFPASPTASMSRSTGWRRASTTGTGSSGSASRPNPSVLTGDIHAFLVSDLRLPGHEPDRLVRRPAGRGHDRAPESPGPDPRQLRCGNRPARRGTGLEWRSLTTTYGGAWVRP
jgi:hypothetical protein